MDRKKAEAPADFSQLKSSLGITEARSVELHNHMSEDVNKLPEKVSQSLVQLWNDEFLSNNEVMYSIYQLGVVEAQSRLMQAQAEQAEYLIKMLTKSEEGKDKPLEVKKPKNNVH